MRFPAVPAVLLVAFLTALVPAAEAGAGNVISPEQTASRLSQCVTVEGQVSLRPAEGRFGQELAFPGGFVAYAPYPISDLSRFDGKTVDITGVIEPGRTHLTEIQLTSPEQIMMTDETPDRLITCDHF